MHIAYIGQGDKDTICTSTGILQGGGVRHEGCNAKGALAEAGHSQYRILHCVHNEDHAVAI